MAGEKLTTTNLHEVYSRPAVSDTEMYLTDILLLCTECGEPIKARINTQQWIRVEWIGPEGECLKCYQEKKAKNETTNTQS